MRPPPPPLTVLIRTELDPLASALLLRAYRLVVPPTVRSRSGEQIDQCVQPPPEPRQEQAG